MSLKLFSKNLRFYRFARGWSQDNLAKRLLVSRATVGHWETGQRYPSHEKLIALCDLFRVRSIDRFVRSDLTQSVKERKRLAA
jgi:transcriptional regulator with XRE-family HTH domain